MRTSLPVMPVDGSPPRKRHRVRNTVLAVLGSIIGLIIIVAVGASGQGGIGAVGSGTSAPAATAASTITYAVDGSPADVTYGPAGSEHAGQVPMTVTEPLGSAVYYAASAQLQGDGSVTVTISVDGRVISTGTASGGYNIATAEISKDPVTGKYTDTQQG